MAAAAAVATSTMSVLIPKTIILHPSSSSLFRSQTLSQIRDHGLRISSCVSVRAAAAKLPSGVEMPKEEPKLMAPFFGFTKTAEVWNSRACMIGLIGTFILELIVHKGVLQMIGVDVGKGLDLPL